MFINDRFVSLRYELKTGDVVEILTSKKHMPSRDWLKFVRSPRALSKIRHSLKISQGIPASNIKILNEDEYIDDSILYIEGLENFKVKFSVCCSPLPGDRIVGYTNLGKSKIVVHTYECSNLSKIKSKVV
ncbi:MAG: bifunctional (p)ppGpp synthetase/guanosine-3',5'-bis(diphosphate) 3'-pyrophosphohydrolase, partial [Bacteroidetes bacterium]|nr:bifunctional (p)ppGpp synthetase/guanosine-3',5'-bis(diphosphate) 3'-pyrophosphohydrolase [Bacteroidota bacterium]